MGKGRFRIWIFLLVLAFAFPPSGWSQDNEDEIRTLEIGPEADTFVDAGYRYSWFWGGEDRERELNFGRSKVLSVTRGLRFGSWGPWDWRAALIRFDLSEIPAEVEIVEAGLSLYHFNLFGENISAHRMLQSWNEMGATWERPCEGCEGWSDGWDAENYVAEPTDVQLVGNGTGWFTWDVTADVRLFVSDTPNHGWLFTSAETEGSDIVSTAFLSRETEREDLRPSLLVRYRFHPPDVTLSADPDTILRGESTTLTWTSRYAESCRIEPGIGLVEPNGSRAEYPTESITYTITAQGQGGTSTQSVTVTVNSPPPTVSLSVVPETIFAGQDATLFWTSADAESVQIGPGLGDVAPSGSMSVSPTETTTYSISVSGPGGTADAAATLVVIPNVDEDQDGLPDGWEQEHFGNLDGSWDEDPDGDQLTNLQEFDLGTDPNMYNPDTDEDRLPDWWELNYFGDLDQGPDDQGDGDGFTNIQEYELETDPTDSNDAPVPGQYYEYDALGRLKGVIVIEPRE